MNWDVQRSLNSAVPRSLGGLGVLSSAEWADLPTIQALAASLIGPPVANLKFVQTVYRCGHALFWKLVEQDQITAILAVLLLSSEGETALVSGEFDGLAPAMSQLASRGSIFALYGWACAGATPEGRRAVMQATALLLNRVQTDLPFYAHAATPEGRRALTNRLGCTPAPGPAAGLFWRPASRHSAAA